jgi:hypothetical protein
MTLLRRPSIQTLLGGATIWALLDWATIESQNINLVPSLILVGASLGPVVFTVYVYERAREVPSYMLLWCFIAGGAVLFLAFPAAYAAAFSGLYLGLIPVLWLFAGRGLGIELRHQFDDPLWRTACDTVFWLSSAALVLVLGAALGNVIRGVPLRSDGYFHLAWGLRSHR